MNDWVGLFPIKFNGPTFWKGKKKCFLYLFIFKCVFGLDDAFLAPLFHFTGAHGVPFKCLVVSSSTLGTYTSYTSKKNKVKKKRCLGDKIKLGT